MLMTTANPVSLHHGRGLHRRWLQFLVYPTFGVLLPLLLLSGGSAEFVRSEPVNNTVIAVLIANLVSWYVLDRLRFYAKSRRLSYVFPVNFFTFGITTAITGIARLPYSIAVYLACFIATIGISYIITAITRASQRTIYVVPGGRIKELDADGGPYQWLTLELFESLLSGDQPLGSIIADLHHDHMPEWERLLAKAALKGIAVYHYRFIGELQTGQVRIDHLSENNLGSLIPNLPYMTMKRLGDLLVATMMLPLLIPFMILVATAIKLDSSGRVFYLQERIGFRGRTFWMIKFRSMRDRTVEDDEHSRRNDAMTKDADNRVTRVGKIIRKLRIDELPQVFNIIKGDMSWIGPRPEALSLAQWYQSSIPFYDYRHIVRPGITGWAQVNQGHVTDLDSITEKLRYDFYYIKNISHWLDLLITLKTIRVILFSSGAR